MTRSEDLQDITFVQFLLWLLRLRRRFRVTGASMLPLLKPGDEVLIDPNAYRWAVPQPGDVVVARHPYQRDVRLIKRVTTVQADGSCQLEGDNPAASTDSRTFGQVPYQHILGRVVCRF